MRHSPTESAGVSVMRLLTGLALGTILLLAVIACGCAKEEAATEADTAGATAVPSARMAKAAPTDASPLAAVGDEAEGMATGGMGSPPPSEEFADGRGRMEESALMDADSEMGYAAEPRAPQPRPGPGLLTAGDVDDNLNFAFFTGYLGRTREAAPVLPAVNLSDRVTIRVVSVDGSPVPSARISIKADGGTSPLIESYAGSDGVFHFFPELDGAGAGRLFDVAVATSGTGRMGIRRITHTGHRALDLRELPDDREIEVTVPTTRPPHPFPLPNALDLMLVIDTTGSMTDELRYLTAEFEGIVKRVAERFDTVDMRFALILYRDEGDEYIVRPFEFTDSVEVMCQQLAEQNSSGGGDYPEAMDQALGRAVDQGWRPGNVARMLFLVADAPPHDEKLQEALDRAVSFRRQGVHIYPVGASGVADTAEYIMRIAAAVTHGRYLFLTDDSGIGNSHAEPHVPGYIVTKLNGLIYRVIASELAGERVEPVDEAIIRRVGNYDRGVCQVDEQ